MKIKQNLGLASTLESYKWTFTVSGLICILWISRMCGPGSKVSPTLQIMGGYSRLLFLTFRLKYKDCLNKLKVLLIPPQINEFKSHNDEMNEKIKYVSENSSTLNKSQNTIFFGCLIPCKIRRVEKETWENEIIWWQLAYICRFSCLIQICFCFCFCFYALPIVYCRVPPFPRYFMLLVFAVFVLCVWLWWV